MTFFFYKQKTAYEMRISDWISDVCSSDLSSWACLRTFSQRRFALPKRVTGKPRRGRTRSPRNALPAIFSSRQKPRNARSVTMSRRLIPALRRRTANRSEEHTSELQSLMRISYAVFCLKKKKKRKIKDETR